MSAKTSIEWTSSSWNPVRGCSRKSPGCLNCYAEGIAYRFSGPGKPFEGLAKLVNGRPTFTGKVRTVPDALDQPLRWIDGRRIFVNSMSDLFHERMPFQFIADVFAVMACTTRHTYQVLTKRPEVMLRWMDWLRGEIHSDWSPDEARRILGSSSYGDFPHQVDPTKIWPSWQPHREGRRGGYDNCGPVWPLENVILGVSIEDAERAAERFPMIAEVARRGWRTMVSMEPLLEEVDVPADYLELGSRAWVVVGGESGRGARPFVLGHAKRIVRQCRSAGVPVFVKQVGAKPVNREGVAHAISDRKGAVMSDWPEELRVREFPE